MDRQEYRFAVAAEDPASAGRGAQALADALRETEGVLEAERRKADEATMDLGPIVEVVAISVSILDIARGVAAWLRPRRGVTLRVERHSGSESIKVAIERIDPETAARIVESIRRG